MNFKIMTIASLFSTLTWAVGPLSGGGGFGTIKTYVECRSGSVDGKRYIADVVSLNSQPLIGRILLYYPDQMSGSQVANDVRFGPTQCEAGTGDVLFVCRGFPNGNNDGRNGFSIFQNPSTGEVFGVIYYRPPGASTLQPVGKLSNCSLK